MITAENLSFSYTGAAPYIFDGMNLKISAGEYVSVLGANGSGKSTLLKLILKFLKPQKGSIEVSAQRIGYVPQRSESASSGFPITVYEMLNAYRRLLKIKDKKVVERSLRLLEMENFKNSLLGNLSGGQSQKIFIARALMGSPDLLVLDEPSNGIDQSSQKEIYGFLKKLNQEKDITIVSVEHNLEAAVSNSTLIYHLHAGHGHLCSPEKYAAEYLSGAQEDNRDA